MVDRESRFSPLFKQESNKISTEDLVKLITEYRRYKLLTFLHAFLTMKSNKNQKGKAFCFDRAEKTSKLQTIPGSLEINVDCVPLECHSMFCNILPNSSLTIPRALMYGAPCIFTLASVCFLLRLCDVVVCSSEAVWGRRSTCSYGGGGGVSAGHAQVRPALQSLQESHLCLP